MTPLRVTILSLTPASGNLAAEGLLVRVLRHEGHEVAVWRCNGVRERCTLDMVNPHVGGRSALCRECASHSEGCLNDWAGGHVPAILLDDWLDPERLAAAYAELARCPDDRLFEFTYDGLPLGDWVPMALRLQYFGESWWSLPDLPAVTRAWLRSLLAVAVAIEAMLVGERPDTVVVLGGTLPWERTATTLAARHGVRCVSYEGGQRPGSLILRDESPAALYTFAPEWAEWADVPLSIAEANRLDGFLRRRQRHGAAMTHVFSPAASGELAALRQRLGLQDGRPVLVAFTSVVVDAAASTAQAAFPSQAAWLEACVGYAAAHPELDLVIRIHPAEASLVMAAGNRIVESPDRVLAVLERAYPTLPANVRVVRSEAAISSYDLMGLAAIVLSYVSTTGMEAAVNGCPVVCAGRIHYGGIGFVWPVRDPDHFRQTLDRLSAAPVPPADAVEKARRYLYFWFFRATPLLPGLPGTTAELLAPPVHPLAFWETPGEVGDLETYGAFLSGRGPFVAPPPAGRPRDGGAVRPLRPPPTPQVLVWLAGWSPADLSEQIIEPLCRQGVDWEIVVLPDGDDWAKSAYDLAKTIQAAGGERLRLRFPPGPMSDADLHTWLARTSVAVPPLSPGAPLALLRSYGIPSLAEVLPRTAARLGQVAP